MPRFPSSPPFLIEAILAIAGLVLLLAVVSPSSGAEPDPTPAPVPEIRAPRWVFAVEDTADLPALFEMSTVEVRTERLGISEIVDRCVRGEEAQRESIDSLEQTVVVKQIYHIGGVGEGARELRVVEQADRMIFRKPDVDRSIPLKMERYKIVDGRREEWDEDDDVRVGLEYGGLAELPFYLEDRDGYSFRILSREIVGDRVIYAVRLEPRSDFEIAPEGTIWIDASSFQILREEFDMSDRVPMPMFVKSIGPIIRERQRVGDVWVWKRMLIRVDLRTGLLKYLDGDIPEAIEFVVTFRDFRANEPPANTGPGSEAGNESRRSGQAEMDG